MSGVNEWLKNPYHVMTIIIILIIIIFSEGACIGFLISKNNSEEKYNKSKSEQFISFLKRFWGPLIIYIFATSIVLLFIAAFIFEKNIALSEMNNWIGIMLGFSSWIVGIISLYLSFYNVDKMIDAQNDNLEKMRETKDQIQKEVKKISGDGWKQDEIDWCYLEDGERIRNEFRKSGNNWYYLGDDGYIVRNFLLEDGDNYYYMDKNGVMVTNRFVTFSDKDNKTMYFKEGGKALKEGKINKDGETYILKDYYVVETEDIK